MGGGVPGVIYLSLFIHSISSKNDNVTTVTYYSLLAI